MKNYFPVVIVGCLASIPVIYMIKSHSHPQTYGTDTVCISGCNSGGFDSDYCKTRCSLDPNAQVQSSGDPADPHCMNACETAGHDSAYCEKPCTYY